MNSQSDFLSEETELVRRLSDPVECEKIRKLAAEFGLQDTFDLLVNLRAEKGVLQNYYKYAIVWTTTDVLSHALGLSMIRLGELGPLFPSTYASSRCHILLYPIIRLFVIRLFIRFCAAVVVLFSSSLLPC
jgi:hypothetical protein